MWEKRMNQPADAQSAPLHQTRRGGLWPSVVFTIRQEAPADYATVYALTKAAFLGTEHCDGDEQDMVERLREKEGFIPALSLVAEQNGQLVGHILFTPMTVGEHPALCLGPVSVLPEFQGQGIGSALIHAGHNAARRLGFFLCVLLGHETYYPRFGYEQASTHGITIPIDAPDKCKMVMFLDEHGRCVRGEAVFPKEHLPGGLE